MAFDTHRQPRRRWPLPKGTIDAAGAAELLQVSVSAIRRRTYAGELRVLDRRSDVGLLLDRDQVEQVARLIESGQAPRDRRKLNGRRRPPNTPVALRRQTRAEKSALDVSTLGEDGAEGAEKSAPEPVSLPSDGLPRRPWRP